jgi:hypothetical protein
MPKLHEIGTRPGGYCGREEQPTSSAVGYDVATRAAGSDSAAPGSSRLAELDPVIVPLLPLNDRVVEVGPGGEC